MLSLVPFVSFTVFDLLTYERSAFKNLKVHVQVYEATVSTLQMQIAMMSSKHRLGTTNRHKKYNTIHFTCRRERSATFFCVTFTSGPQIICMRLGIMCKKLTSGLSCRLYKSEKPRWRPLVPSLLAELFSSAAIPHFGHGYSLDVGGLFDAQMPRSAGCWLSVGPDKDSIASYPLATESSML